jgi:hypothetical protein
MRSCGWTYGILTAYEVCTDATREDEFNSWYTHMHLPDLGRARGLLDARRYRMSSPSDPAVYLAVYEFESEDLTASVNDLLRLAVQSYELGRHIECVRSVDAPATRPAVWIEILPHDVKVVEAPVPYPTSSPHLDKVVFNRIASRLDDTMSTSFSR